MPEGQGFWNPYRWVAVSDQPVERRTPRHHHNLSGLAGRLWCDIEALTPLLIGDGEGRFVRRGGIPYLPATSLKGAIRSLAEVVGNAAVPFPSANVDGRHRLEGAPTGPQVDIAARMFGHLHGRDVFAGLVCFSDAPVTGESPPLNLWPRYEVAVGQPKPQHRAFYPGNDRRKFYHHRPTAQKLTPPHAGITQTDHVQPAPPGTRFRFTVDFENLGEEELDLLLYCLILEEQAVVNLSPAALGRSADESGETLRGPLRHKIGGAKPHGAGSVHIRIKELRLCADRVARYRGRESAAVLQGGSLASEVDRRTEPFRIRRDRTMQELRAMLIYHPDDQRTPIGYPTYGWFRAGAQTPLKPTV